MGLRIHDLRHICSSLLTPAGANPKAVQTHLGHSSITVTMDRYTHLFPSDIDHVIRRLEDIGLEAPRTRSSSPKSELAVGLEPTTC